MPDVQGAVFISYASQDAEAARRICEALRAGDIEVWFDQSELRGGDAWDHQIRRQIKDCALFIPIISSHTQARTEGYFRLEWHLADQRKLLMSKNRPFLLPVCIDGTPDADAEVPDSFSAAQWTRLSAGETPPAFVERVLGLLLPKSPLRPSAIHSSTAAAPERAALPRQAAPAQARIRRGILLVAVLGILVVGYLVVQKSLLSRRPPAGLPGTALQAQSASPAHNAMSEKSIAVLPFVDMSEKHDQEYFADGLTEELIDHLSRSGGGLRVIARTSSFYFKGRQTTIKDVANTLNVGNVLEGSVRKSGKALRISVKLNRAADGAGLWSQTYDRSFSDIFKVQSEIAAQVATELDTVLNGASDPSRGTSNVDAYNLVLEGKYYDSRGNHGDLALATAAYRRAVQLDSHYADAWVRMGYAYMSQDFREVDKAFAERAAADAANRALAVDSKFAPAYHLIGDIATYLQWNWNAADVAYQRALTFADTQERSRIRLDSLYLQALRSGRFDSNYRRLLEEALIVNPLDTNLMRGLAFDYLYAGESAKCLELMQHAREINPMAEGVNSAVAYALMLMGRFDEAWTAAQSEVSTEDKRQISAMLAWSLGHRAESDQLVAAIERPPTSAYTNAQIHTWRGEKDEAVQWLMTAFRERETGLVSLRLDPVLRRLETDPRYEALLLKMNLSDSEVVTRPAGEQK